MIYPYQCHCGAYREFVRPAVEAGLPATCPVCQSEMIRIWTVPQIDVPFRGYYNNGLGCRVERKSDIRDRVNKIKDTTGREIEELGNEHVKHEPKTGKYDFTPAEMTEMCNIGE